MRRGHRARGLRRHCGDDCEDRGWLPRITTAQPRSRSLEPWLASSLRAWPHSTSCRCRRTCYRSWRGRQRLDPRIDRRRRGPGRVHRRRRAARCLRPVGGGVGALGSHRRPAGGRLALPPRRAASARQHVSRAGDERAGSLLARSTPVTSAPPAVTAWRAGRRCVEIRNPRVVAPRWSVTSREIRSVHNGAPPFQ